MPNTAIDHNILRSINATGNEPGEYKLEIEDDSHMEGSRRSSMDSKAGGGGFSSLLTVPAGNVGAGAAKKPTPNPAERLNIRKEMLTFFEGSRDSEIDQVCHVSILTVDVERREMFMFCALMVLYSYILFPFVCFVSSLMRWTSCWAATSPRRQ